MKIALEEREHYLWTEKYRPVSLENYIGGDTFKDRIQGFIDRQDIPHILLSGIQGTGKTTLAKIICTSIECDTLYINASDENSVDTIRTKVKTFSSRAGFSNLKVVILDEADFITVNGQAVLRNLMETFSAHCRFILTCNYVEKIIPPIVSRTQHFKVYPPSKAEVAKHLVHILQLENISFDLEDIKLLIHSYYPDIRKVINEAQLSVDIKTDSLSIDRSTIIGSDFKLALLNHLTERGSDTKKINNIRQLVADHGIRTFNELYSFLYERLTEYTDDSTISEAILAVADGQYKDSLVVDSEINFMATIVKLIKII